MAAFRQLSGHMQAVDDKAKALNRRQTMIAKGAREMHMMLLRYAAPAALATAGVRATKDFAAVERRMSRIGITAEASIADTAAALDNVRQIANDLGAPVDQVVDGLDSLTASGKTMREALDLLPAVSGAAHAAGAEFSDMATTADSIANSFGIASDRMQTAFDILAKGGKEGKFELRDMAAELPSLAPAFAALGYKGEAGLKRLVAMLQTVRLETGTSGEAATSFMDVLTKMESETVSNNFKKKFGVDLRRELAAARRSGEDILDAFVRLSNLAVKGDLSKLPQLFTDKQMLIGMRAIMRNTQALKDYQAAMNDAAGTVGRDLDRIAAETQSKLDRVGNSWKRIKEQVGEGLVDMGLGTALDVTAEALSKGQAINRGLDKTGMTEWQKSLWKLRSNFDPTARDRMAYSGGYRSPESKRTAALAEEYGARRRQMRDLMTLGGQRPIGKDGFPIDPPLPSPRPGSPAAEPIVLKGPRPPSRPRPFAAGQSPRDAERESMAALRSDPNGVADAIDEAIAAGGERASKRIEEAAQKVNDAGGEAGSAFARMLDGLGERFGAQAADSFKRNVGTLTVNARVSGTAGRAVSADVGRAGGDIVTGAQ